MFCRKAAVVVPLLQRLTAEQIVRHSRFPAVMGFPAGLLGFGIALGAAVLGQAGDQPLLFHAEVGSEHRVLLTKSADQPFNPASVIKVATSMLALKTLGPDHRFVTDFACRGQCSVENGRLQGDLVIIGGADPIFRPKTLGL